MGNRRIGFMLTAYFLFTFYFRISYGAWGSGLDAIR